MIGVNIREWFAFGLRWLPPIGLMTCLAGVCFVPSFRHFLVDHGGVASVLVLLTWTIAAWIIAIRAHQRFVRNLRTLIPKHALIAGSVVGLLVVLRHSISPSLVPLSLLLMHIAAAGERPRLTLAGGVFAAMLTVVLVEGLFAVPLSIPALWNVPGFDVIALRRYWMEINLIQWNPACARWDPELSYTLRPGTCTFSNPGYQNEYRINTLGVRDDEESLHQPEIVVLGDSHTMGMGVAQDETYPSQLETMVGLKTLNTGVSSYGTARELGILERVDRSRARYLLIQYCSNDFDENREFIDSGGKLPRRDREWFDSHVEADNIRRRYYLGKFTDSLAWSVWQGLQVRMASESHAAARSVEQSNQSLDYLLKVIDRHPVDLTGMKVIILEMEFPADYREENASRLERLLAGYQGSRRLSSVQILDVMKGLGPEYFLPLDGHMNPLGHRRVAERVASMIR